VNRWASRALGASSSDFLTAIRSEIPVALIATPRAALKCQREDRWQQIESDRDLADFDQVPLTDDDENHIVAVFIRGTGPVALRENMFMASGAPLISFLESADHHRFRLLLRDRRVSGMVTLSDVQKLPVYSVLFSLLIVVEMLLMDCIRKACGANADQWLRHLDKRQRGTIEKHWNNAVKKNLAIDRLSCASFGQEITAALGLGLFKGHDEHYTSLTDLEALRNQVCHATEFAPTAEQALTIPCRVREAQAAATWLQAQIRASSA
jgi:hypothetical protein